MSGHPAQPSAGPCVFLPAAARECVGDEASAAVAAVVAAAAPRLSPAAAAAAGEAAAAAAVAAVPPSVTKKHVKSYKESCSRCKNMMFV